jgi:Rad3-related DNA helicase
MTYALKTSILRRVTSDHLVEQEEALKKMSRELKKLKRKFNLAQVAILDLEKKVVELADALKKCQDEKRVAEEEKKATQGALENYKKDLEKLQNTHEEDLKLIENLRKDHDKSFKATEDLRAKNVDLAKTLSSKEQKIRDLEKALADREEFSGKEVAEIKSKLELLLDEYRKALREFGVRPAPLTVSEEIFDFMGWIDAEFKALPGVIFGASDLTAAFSVESILKLLHVFDCADLVKFREKLTHFPDASSTSIIRTNEDVLAIKIKFTKEFWFASGKEVAKTIARVKLDQVNFSKASLVFRQFTNFPLWFLKHFSFHLCFFS